MSVCVAAAMVANLVESLTTLLLVQAGQLFVEWVVEWFH
jgi:hypothetical protein